METTSFVGRREELADLRQLLGGSGLVTLTGVGGVGKSRLALRAAAQAEEVFADGMWLVELSPLQDPALLAHTVAETLQLADRTSRPQLEVLGEWLADKRLLLILDTCEHLIEGCARLTRSLLALAPELRILATSRQRLGVPGEHVLEVPPLRSEDEATALFAERAAVAAPGLDLDDAERAAEREAVRQVCRRLDRLPLAIELAAAQLRVMSLDQLSDRFHTRFDTLPGPRHRAALPRHQTMRTAIGWSHELCTPRERLLWARLSVFAGGCSPEAARVVCAGGPLAAADVPEVLESLADKSVLQRERQPDGARRYRMLDTLREFGNRWLCELDEDFVLQRRHRDFYGSLAARGSEEWTGPNQVAWYRRMVAEHANLRAALDFSLTEPDASALELAGTLWFFWFACGFPREGRRYLERALARGPQPLPERAQALYACALVTFAQGDGAEAEKLAQASLDAAERLGDPAAVARACHGLGASRAVQGKQQSAAEALDEAPRVRGATGSCAGARLLAMATRAFVHVNVGEYDEGAAVADVLRQECAARGETWCGAYGDYVRSLADLGRGRVESAERHARAALEARAELHDIFGLAMSLDLLASIAAAGGDGERAARLLGTGQRLWLTFGMAQLGSPELAAARNACEQRARATAGDAAYEAAYAAGLRTELDESIAQALSG